LTLGCRVISSSVAPVKGKVKVAHVI